MNDADADADFDKADIILADALQRFQADGVSPYVYGMARMRARSPSRPGISPNGWRRPCAGPDKPLREQIPAI
jgi:hypothetical protein